MSTPSQWLPAQLKLIEKGRKKNYIALVEGSQGVFFEYKQDLKKKLFYLQKTQLWHFTWW